MMEVIIKRRRVYMASRSLEPDRGLWTATSPFSPRDLKKKRRQGVKLSPASNRLKNGCDLKRKTSSADRDCFGKQLHVSILPFFYFPRAHQHVTLCKNKTHTHTHTHRHTQNKTPQWLHDIFSCQTFPCICLFFFFYSHFNRKSK